METETKNLATLVRFVLQKKTFCPHHAEIAGAISALQAASKITLLLSEKPNDIVYKIREALNVLSGLLFLLCNNILFINAAAQKNLIQQATQLHKNLNDNLNQYCNTEFLYDSRYSVKMLVTALSEINNTLKENTALTSLYLILQPEFEKVIQTKTFTFHRWLWWSRFATLCNTQIDNTDLLEQFLIKLNFNIPAFINFLSENLTKQAVSIFSTQEKSHLLTKQLLKYKTIDSLYTGYLPAENSVRQKMLCLLQTQLKLLSNPLLVNYVSDKQLLKFNTVLSVPQLALFIRLMVETKILNETNQSALLKNIACFISTSKAASLSPESLRINYYTPNLPAKNIIKEYLSQMLRLVNSY